MSSMKNLKQWKNPEVRDLSIRNTQAATLDSKGHDGVWRDYYDKDGELVDRVELHS